MFASSFGFVRPKWRRIAGQSAMKGHSSEVFLSFFGLVVHFARFFLGFLSLQVKWGTAGEESIAKRRTKNKGRIEPSNFVKILVIMYLKHGGTPTNFQCKANGLSLADPAI